MDDNNGISGNPKFSKMRKELQDLQALKPLVNLMGVKKGNFQETLDELTKFEKSLEELSSLPDKFNEIFSDIGWIATETIDVEVMKKAIKIAKDNSLENADIYLADYYSAEWVEKRINWLKYIKGFAPRFELAQKALEDYKAERYYASVLVVLAIIDGWVAEMNVVDFQRLGFFAERSEITAWDSIAAHSSGLQKLKEVFGKPRMMTRSEKITIPFRHGIMHGMDFGYDNKLVAAKCWAALFGIREWVIKASRNELMPPVITPEKETSLWESIEKYQKVQREKEAHKRWQPRNLQVGKDIPQTGSPDNYLQGTPEAKLAEFMIFWRKRNYGYMAKCFAPMLNTQPTDVRENFQSSQLNEFEIIEVKDMMSWITDIKVLIQMTKENNELAIEYEFRIALNTPNGEMAFIQNDETVWGITSWTQGVLRK